MRKREQYKIDHKEELELKKQEQKEHRREYARQYAKAHKDERNAYQRKYYKEHEDKRIAQNKRCCAYIKKRYQDPEYREQKRAKERERYLQRKMLQK